MKPVIFSDLDGTLLDPRSQSYAGAERALARIASEDIPLIFSSSKTRSEIERHRQAMDNRHPFIAENGAAVFIPAGYFPFAVKGSERLDGYEAVILGTPYVEVRKALEEVRRETGIKAKGFGDLTDEEVARLTGIGREMAELAKRREFAEPFTMQAEERPLKEFLKRIEKKGLSWTRGELFHIMGRHDKGKAVRILKDYYTALYGSVVTIGLGDSSNDIPLLKEVDYPVLVKKPDGEYEPVKVQGVIRAEGIGPEGWNKAVLGILDSIDSSYRGYTC